MNAVHDAPGITSKSLTQVEKDAVTVVIAAVHALFRPDDTMAAKQFSAMADLARGAAKRGATFNAGILNTIALVEVILRMRQSAHSGQPDHLEALRLEREARLAYPLRAHLRHRPSRARRSVAAEGSPYARRVTALADTASIAKMLAARRRPRAPPA